MQVRRRWAHDHRAECHGKERYCTKGAAIERIKRKERQRKFRDKSKAGWSKGMVLVPYHCCFCHHWHIGSTSKWDTHGRPS